VSFNFLKNKRKKQHICHGRKSFTKSKKEMNGIIIFAKNRKKKMGCENLTVVKNFLNQAVELSFTLRM
jgi:hypothetical protein